VKAFVRLSAITQEVALVDAPEPPVDAHEILVAVEAFGVGIHDRYFVPPQGPLPYVVGSEGAGIVRSVGREVRDVTPGDRVMVSTGLNPKGGSWAELVALAASSTLPMPEGLGFDVAAGIPVAGKTAVECLHTLALASGETLFVAGASGAIGTLVVQMAARRGVRVAGSASVDNHEYLRSLGAELAVDYRDPAWVDQVRRWAGEGADAALAIQPGTAPASQAAVRDAGRVVTVSGDPCPSERGIRVEQFVHRPDARSEMVELVDDISEGRIELVLERVHPFEDALSALEKTETRHARGKVVVRVGAPG